MKNINGYLCIVPEKFCDYTQEHLYGPSANPEVSPCERFSCNGFIVFQNFSEAGLAKRYLEKQLGVKVGLARIEMAVAETIEESELSFKDLKDLIVIQATDYDKKLIGRHTEFLVKDAGLPDYPVPGLQLAVNGFRPIESFEEAKEISWQRHRQTTCKCTIASFSFTRL